ncbi:hypothetical protein ACH5RR_025207 [Cinchona calisaya]|uniref:Vacuolar ATPase assembly protein VMA22 n=1 Tax=Cinchona calisaya TaxID=153742 RepID=A0ABD2Z2B1_9GENT
MVEDDAPMDSHLQSSSDNNHKNQVNESNVNEIENPEKEVNEENVLKFLDSMDDYLILLNSLYSILRQGWLELASAKHSMGASRVNTSLFDLKHHLASTTLQLNYQNEQPHFVLRKWESSDTPRGDTCEAKFEEEKLIQGMSNGLRIRSRGRSDSSEMQEKGSEDTGSQHSIDDQAKKERLKSLSMFGALVSPKLRSAQLSFETALETLTEIANVRASLLCAYEQAHKEMESSKQ